MAPGSPAPRDAPRSSRGASLSTPRVFGIPAARAPIVAVLRRGPTGWSHVGRWDVARGVYEPGAWIRASLYPQRCDLSPDGRWLCFFTLKAGARWSVGATYLAISRLPWLAALAAWGTCGTWTSGLHFVEDRSVWEVGAPATGDAAPCRARVGLAVTRPASFAVERRRVWTETIDTPARPATDIWDQARAERITMDKPRPGSAGTVRLRVRGWYAAFRALEPKPDTIVYDVMDGGEVMGLEDVQWADWDADGRLLVATRAGRLEVRDGARPTRATPAVADVAALAPAPAAPPDEALRW
jgi:hypothetical protein